MPHALLLSPDDQAVSAITGVLEEMSVTCERPLDGVSAAQKLSSQSFDLVLVDCENLPAAKLIFDVCRRGKNGNNPVPIAIVDGRAGLPTAFRLGAELILTKPVAKDQARTTIRTAVGRVRKDVPANDGVPTQAPEAIVSHTSVTAEPEPATVASVSSQLTSFADQVPTFMPATASTSAETPAPASDSLFAATLKTSLHSAVDHSAVDHSAVDQSVVDQSAVDRSTVDRSTLDRPAVDRSAVDEDEEDEIDAPPIAAKAMAHAASPASSLLESSSPLGMPAAQRPARPFAPSDDPVLAELERTELEELIAVELKTAEAQTAKSRPAQVSPDKSITQAHTPVFSSQQEEHKSRGPLVALVIVSLASAGLYAVWTLRPDLRAMAQPQIDRVLTLAGIPQHSPHQSMKSVPAATNTTKPSTPQAAKATTPSLQVTADLTQSPSPDPDSAAPPVNRSAATPGATAAVQSSAPARVEPSTSAAATPPVTDPGKPANAKGSAKTNDTRKAEAQALVDSQLPGESSAIILSSKGAEKRLAHSVPAKYPAGAGSGATQGTIVLKEVVDATGKVDGVRLVEGDATLATSAIDAVKQWRYRPYVRDGKAQPFQTIVIIDFQTP